MSLRYRLFLLVSGLFVVIAACSYLIQNFSMHRGLEKAQAGMRQKIIELSEKRREDLQNYLASVLAENEEKLNAILTNLSSFTPQLLRFGPTLNNNKNGTWKEAADLLIEYKWLDFLQNTNEGKVASLIIPRQTNLEPVYRIAIDDDLCWIYSHDLKSHPDPYLGIRIPYDFISKTQVNGSEIPETVAGVIPEAYLLFDAKDLASRSSQYNQPVFQTNHATWSPISVKWTEGYELEVTPVLNSFQRARELLLNNKIQFPQENLDQILKKMQGISAEHRGKLSPIPVDGLLSSDSTGKILKERLEEIALNYAQISMIWVLIAFYDSGIFGDHLFSFPAPIAISLFGGNADLGMGVVAKEVLSSQRFFDDSSYFARNPPTATGSNLASSLAVITAPGSEHIYLGNTAQFTVKTSTEERIGYLTLAADIDIVLQRLVFAIHQTALLVRDGHLLSAYSDEGEQFKTDDSALIPLAEMVQKKSGIIEWNKQNYFFMHLQPFPSVDLHFFLLNPEEAEFALLRELKEGSQEIVDSILLNIHIAGLIALVVAILLVHNIARKVTKPIAQLAKATNDVAEGRLDQAHLSLPPLKHHDEVAVLCHAFEEMIKGLKEKEKVKGVLNKVVSNEIAQEILKGNVHLGGEEKKVTVLFADIRDFAKMSQNMLPQQVVEMLNGCMTKISSVIDKNQGVIDKFVGDEAMALFGAPISHNDAAFKAITAALEIVEVLKSWNQERKSRNMPEIEMGIGIHTGLMLAGNMGAENRLNYTVIGSNVNLASRLCAAAKRMEILMTKGTLDEPFVKDKIIYEELPAITFKGFDQPVPIFKVTGIKN